MRRQWGRRHGPPESISPAHPAPSHVLRLRCSGETRPLWLQRLEVPHGGLRARRCCLAQPHSTRHVFLSWGCRATGWVASGTEMYFLTSLEARSLDQGGLSACLADGSLLPGSLHGLSAPGCLLTSSSIRTPHVNVMTSKAPISEDRCILRH